MPELESDILPPTRNPGKNFGVGSEFQILYTAAQSESDNVTPATSGVVGMGRNGCGKRSCMRVG